MVFRSVDLPTPFRPRTDSTRPSATSRLMLNSTCAGPYQVLSSVQRSIEVLAQVDLLHPSISAYRVGGTVEDLPAKHFDLQIGVNLRGLFLVTQAAIPLLRETRGWIVNLASIAGTLPAPGLATYGATKAAVISLTHSLNEELDADGVRAVAICPGFVDTAMAQWSGIAPDEMIRPEDCAEVVRMVLRLSPHARVPQVVIERVGSRNGDAPLGGA